jgi:hypothetical protein
MITFGAVVQISKINTPNTLDAPLQAGSIFVEGADSGTLRGPVQSIDLAGRSFTILNQKILVNDATTFVGNVRSGATAFCFCCW